MPWLTLWWLCLGTCHTPSGVKDPSPDPGSLPSALLLPPTALLISVVAILEPVQPAPATPSYALLFSFCPCCPGPRHPGLLLVSCPAFLSSSQWSSGDSLSRCRSYAPQASPFRGYLPDPVLLPANHFFLQPSSTFCSASPSPQPHSPNPFLLLDALSSLAHCLHLQSGSMLLCLETCFRIV